MTCFVVIVITSRRFVPSVSLFANADEISERPFVSSDYDGANPHQRLADISGRLSLIDKFLVGQTRETFVRDKKTQLAIVRLLEEICEAAYRFVKNASGTEMRHRYPEIDFGAFGGLGNIYRHQYGPVDYELVWDDIHGTEIRAVRAMAERESGESE